MKVLHLVHNYFPSVGGSQLLFQKLSEGLVAQHGDQVTVFTTNALKSPSFLDNELLPSGTEVLHGVTVRRFPFWRRPLPVLKRAMKLANRGRIPLRAYLEPLVMGPISPEMFVETLRADADVISCMSFPFLQMYYPARRRTPTVLFGALHLRDDHEVPAPILRMIDKASAYVAFTEFEKDTLVRNGIRADQIHVVGLGVDVDRFAAASGDTIRKRYGIGDAPVVAFVGRQAPHKGCDTLIRAMTTVWDRRPDAHLVLAGARTAFSEQLERMVNELPADKRQRVTLVHGFTEDEKPDWFAACDVFVSVSTDESFGIVFVEAWAARKAVIGGRIGAVECLIRDGEDGFLVPCGEPEPLASSIERLLDDEGLRTRMGRSGHARVRAENDWPMVVDKCRRIYADVV